MGTEKRERQKANRAARIAAEEAAEAKARRIKTIRNVVLFGVGIIEPIDDIRAGNPVPHCLRLDIELR